jgi:hypothetical protein
VRAGSNRAAALTVLADLVATGRAPGHALVTVQAALDRGGNALVQLGGVSAGAAGQGQGQVGAGGSAGASAGAAAGVGVKLPAVGGSASGGATAGGGSH